MIGAAHLTTYQEAKMPTTRTLEYRLGHFAIPYYRDLKTFNAIICAAELYDHVGIPRGQQSINVITTNERPDHEEYFDIRKNGKLVHVRVPLVHEFQWWLETRYNEGDRFVYFDYEE